MLAWKCEKVEPWTEDGIDRKARVGRYVEDNLSRPITSEELAGVASMSRFHFSRWFKREFGETPRRYIACRRGKEAVRLIKTTRLPLCEIAYRCGYASQSHMTDCFRKGIGVTPGEYRRGVV